VAEPEPEPIPEISQVTAEPEVLRVAEIPQPERREEVPEVVAAPAPDPVPVEMAGFISESLAIRDSELQDGLSVVGPSELKGHTHYPSWRPVSQPMFEILPMAALVGYEGRVAVWPGEPSMVTTRVDVKDFSGAGLSMDVPIRPTRPKGIGSADQVRVTINSRKAGDATYEWHSETSVFVFGLTFQQTTRSDSPIDGVGFPGDQPGREKAAAPSVVETEQVPSPDMEGSPRAALEALARLKEEVEGDPGQHRGPRNNGTRVPPEAEPVIDTAALEWLFNNGAGTTDPAAGSPPSRSKREEEESPVTVPAVETAQPETAPPEIEPSAVASEPVEPIAVEEPEPEPEPGLEKEVTPEIPKTAQFITIPVKVFLPAKARLAQGSQALAAKPSPELPRIEAQPLRPKMSLRNGPAVETALSSEITAPETIQAPPPVSVQAPVLVQVPVELAPKAASRPVFVKTTEVAAPDQPAKEQTVETKPAAWKTSANPKTEEPQKNAAPPPPVKRESKASPAPEPEETELVVPGISFATASSSSFWGALPLAARITIAAIILVIVAAVIYLTSFSHKTMAAGDAAGASIIMGEGGWITDWAGDSTGLHRGRQISIYRPSLKLSDYRISFQGRVENASIGWVFRAVDASNYYAMKLTQTSSGFKLVKYAVVNGQEHEQGSFAVSAAASGWFSIRVDVRGGKFNTFIDGKDLDMWTDEQLKTGGVGFLNDRGERADIKGIAISYLAGMGK
jgi:hypothetical protein